jgi:D-alanine-D-alanine ligase
MVMRSPGSQSRSEKAMTPAVGTIGVLMGGISREREVSLLSGAAVASALGDLGHGVRAMDVGPDDIASDLFRGVDVVFLALHGAWGEDGTLQRRLDELGVCYTGSGPEASRLAMDKVAAKARFFEEGVPTPAFRLVERGNESALIEAAGALGARLVVKPVADGSSIDVAMADALPMLRRAVRQIWARGEPALVERCVVGREFTVAVLGEEALPTIEIRVPGGWYDYHFKYESDHTQYVFDHGLPAERERRMIEVALAAHRALGCRDLSRVDVMMPEGGEPQVLEVNTLPGFTSHSLVPKAAARAGLSFGRLCERIVELARARKKA